MYKFVRIFFLLLLSLTLLAGLTPNVFALDVPNFASCGNPSGTVKSDYPNGTHGIAGNTGSFSGSDKVFNQGNGNALQCFCPASGSGIQTQWLKANSYSEADIQILKNQGWVYIPNGALWGLDDTPYLALNSNFTCSGGSTNSSSGGDVQGTSTSGSVAGQVLGLAATGNAQSILVFLAVGLISLLIGINLKKKA